MPDLFRDLFVALGEPLGNEGAWSLRVYHKPFIRWIWLGAIFMAVGWFSCQPVIGAIEFPVKPKVKV